MLNKREVKCPLGFIFMLFVILFYLSKLHIKV